MPSISKLEGTPRKELHVFYVLDTSGSMEGASISSLNHAMEETTDALKSVAKSNGDAILKIAVLEFNSGCNWVTSNGPELLEDFEWEYLEAGGLTDIGSALEELNRKLSRKEFLNSMTGAFMPVIIFMTDGYATDNYEKALIDIRENRWFHRGTKIGFAIGDDPDIFMLSSIVGNSEAVIRTTDLSLFSRLMKFVSVTSSMLVSTSQVAAAETGGNGIVDMLQKEGEGIPADALVHLDDDEYDKEDAPTDSDDGWDDGEW